MKRLAFWYQAASFSAMSLSDAARDACEIEWIVDTSEPGVEEAVRLLRRLGPVTDLRDLDEAESVRAVAARAPDGILALAEEKLLPTARMAERIGLRSVSPDVALSLQDKHLQRQVLRGGGVATPGFWAVSRETTEADWEELRSQISFPAVLKPRRGLGSRNTTRIETFAALRHEIEAVGTAEGQQWVVEEYLQDVASRDDGGFAPYVSVESVVVDRTVHHVAITGRLPPAEPFRETGFFVPCALADFEQSEVLVEAALAAQALGIERGCLHTEVKLTPDGPRIIEVNGRIGGGIRELVQAVYGIDLLRAAFQVALGSPVDLTPRSGDTPLAWLLYCQAPSNMKQLVSVDGMPEPGDRHGVLEVVLNRRPGDSLDWREGNHGYVFSVFGQSSNHQEFQNAVRAIYAAVVIEGK